MILIFSIVISVILFSFIGYDLRHHTSRKRPRLIAVSSFIVGFISMLIPFFNAQWFQCMLFGLPLATLSIISIIRVQLTPNVKKDAH
ncbi:hypothetical protein [Kurthia massiliensis]|uniref:hypothetical protein n=1 Tax=Kurthia massiliensis TaxID=1033739 RepID=UPI00028916E7|nr:hypothetical protein [Kurthia massiliensis]